MEQVMERALVDPVLLAHRDPAPFPARRVPEVEIVIPVFNEERVLAGPIYRLHGYLSRVMPFSWQITLADNASTDCTLK